MIKQSNELRNSTECYGENLYKLERDEKLLAEEKALYLQLYFSSLITPDMTFEKAAKSAINGYNRLIAGAEEDGLWSEEKIALCRMLADRYAGAPVFKRGFPTCPASAPIALWGVHSISRVGYERFSALFHSVEKISLESFAEVCDFVSDQSEAFGIVPLENTTDGRLAAFYKMLDRSELKICAVCDVEDPDTDTVTRLALISKVPYSFEGDFFRHMEFSLVVSEAQKRTELLGIIEKMGFSLTSLLSLPLSYRENAGIETVRVSLANQSAVPFLIYLYLFCEDINILGFYIQM